MACSGLLDNLSVFTQRIFSSVSLVCVLFYNSWQLALIAVVVLGCAFAPVAKLQKRIKSVMEKTVFADVSDSHWAYKYIYALSEANIINGIDEEHFEFHVKVQTSPLFYAWVLNFGDDVKITAPLDVQEALVERLRKVLDQYPT